MRLWTVPFWRGIPTPYWKPWPLQDMPSVQESAIFIFEQSILWRSKRLRIAIDQAKEMGMLGENIFGSGFDFDIELKLGAGAFVCGEETALIRSIEGKRGEPTTKPPFPAESGVWGKPTIVNNVETLANIPVIINRGGDWFKKIGTEKSSGTKVFALAGKNQ